MAKTKKLISFVLVAAMAFTLLAGFNITASAEGVSVNIVSFLRGEQENLRSSELLEARVSGYDGNVRELTYEWTNDIGTYLYVFNDHNMYGINGTEGEIEIYNDQVSESSNMAGRSYDTTFSAAGFAWAAIYGANYDNSDLLGTITVTVKDADGKVLATDTHTGTRTQTGGNWWWPTYTYSGFVTDNLEADIKATHFGIFEGDAKQIRELFSESSIVHITCTASSVNNPVIASGSEYITLTENSDGTYTVNAIEDNADGNTVAIKMSVTKDNCKFHQNTSGETAVNVYVYKRPEPTPTTTTITLTNLDERCTYYINGNTGRRENGVVVFEGLNPNTTYTIEAVGYVEGTEAVYAYTECTTLPVYNATVYVYLNGGFDAETNTAYGTPVNISDIRDTDDAIYIKETNSSEFIQLSHADIGVYTAAVENGTYLIYRDAEENSNPSTQQLIINNGDKERYLFYYSVDYDAAGGEGEIDVEYYYEGSPVVVTDLVPAREGYEFKGWVDQDGKCYKAGDMLTNDIEKAYTLTALWEETIDVYVNIYINHTAEGDQTNHDASMHNVTFTVDARKADAGDYTELENMTIEWDGEAEFTKEGFDADFSHSENKWITSYTANGPTFTNMPSGMEYTFTSAKHSYDLENVQVTEDENGDVIISAYLVFNPINNDFTFKVRLDEESKALPDELKPIAADVKVTCYFDSPYVDGDDVQWTPIGHHNETYEKVTLDENGEGVGSYPVWSMTSGGEKYYYRVEVVSYVLPDGSIMPAKDVDNQHEYYTTDDERYTAYVEVDGGSNPSGSALSGAYFEDTTQIGEVTATISIEIFNVILDPNGGSFADNTTQAKVLEYQLAVPNLAAYTPTREGGYVFDGWYLADENGNITSNTVAEGDMLKSDITLIAAWKEPLKIEGTVSVAGTYELMTTQVIYDLDRVQSVMVLLRHLDENGYEATTESVTVPIVYENNVGTGTYSFTLPDDGHEHHVSVTSTNYATTYQNELSESTVVTDYWAYTLNHGEAEFNGDKVAMVNAYLAFDPVTFDLQYEIDATAIGEGFRPSEVETLILCDDGQNGHNPQNWTIISQMAAGSGFEGEETVLSEGYGLGSYPVWNSKPDGATLYDYAIRIDKVDGVSFNADTVPYMIYYNGSARYSALTGQTQILKATIVPKMYTITFDLNAGEDPVSDMEDYYNVTGEYQDTYYWSFGTSITAKPVRENYAFLGWFDENGNTVTEITADMHENVVVTAQWKKLENYQNDYAYIFGYNDQIMGAEGNLLRCELSAMIHRLVKQNGKLGDFVYDASNPSFDDIEGKWFQSGIEYMNHKGAFDESATSVYPYIAVTRGEAFKFICLGLGFVENTTLTHQEYADFLYSAGYIIGDGSGDLKVNDNVTRAEFCTMYNRIIGRENALLETEDGTAVTAETYGFIDMTDPTIWYYNSMVRATSAYENGYVSIEKRGIRNVLDDYNN